MLCTYVWLHFLLLWTSTCPFNHKIKGANNWLINKNHLLTLMPMTLSPNLGESFVAMTVLLFLYPQIPNQIKIKIPKKYIENDLRKALEAVASPYLNEEEVKILVKWIASVRKELLRCKKDRLSTVKESLIKKWKGPIRSRIIFREKLVCKVFETKSRVKRKTLFWFNLK